MENSNVENQLVEINKKLDFLTEQVAIYARRQREFEELKDDLKRIGTDVFQTAVVELNEVSHHFDTNDVMHLIKKLLRNIRNISKIFDQMESAADFIQDFTPNAKAGFIEILHTLDEMDRKGYFEFLKEAVKIADNVVASFTPDDVRALGDNMVTILSTVKNLTQPDMLQAINNAVSVYKNLDFDISEKVSYFDLFKEAKAPEMRRGIVFGIHFLKNLASSVNQQEIVNN